MALEASSTGANLTYLFVVAKFKLLNVASDVLTSVAAVAPLLTVFVCRANLPLLFRLSELQFEPHSPGRQFSFPCQLIRVLLADSCGGRFVFII